MFSDDHILIHPYHNNTTDPNCYCTCKQWHLDTPLQHSPKDRQMLHLYHCLDVLAMQLESIREQHSGSLEDMELMFTRVQDMFNRDTLHETTAPEVGSE